MLIKPQVYEKDVPRFRNGFEVCDDDRKLCYKRRRYACNNEGAVRVEDLRIYPNEGYVWKDVATGNVRNRISPQFKQSIDIHSHMYSTFDLKSGERLMWGAESAYPSTSGVKSHQFIGYYDTPYPSTIFMKDTDSVYKTNIVGNLHYPNNYNYDEVKLSLCATEDTMQMSYIETVGFLNAFFSQAAFSYPADSYVILDSKSGTYNIPKFVYIDALDKTAGLNLYKEYAKDVSNVAKIFKYNCDKEKRHLRAYVFTSAFCTVVKIKDCDHKEFDIDMNINASDHFGSMIDNMIIDYKNFIFSEECGTILKTKNGDVSDEMINACDTDLFKI